MHLIPVCPASLQLSTRYALKASGCFLVVGKQASGWCKWGSDRERVVRGEYSAAETTIRWSAAVDSCLEEKEDDVKPTPPGATHVGLPLL